MIINGYPLDENQLKPILENPKYSLIIAGAGSGKTTTLIGKIKYLIEEKKVLPEQIVCITFTNDAVNHIEESLKQNHINLDCFTFHKLALTILKENHETYQIASPFLLKETIDEFFASDGFGNPEFKKIMKNKFAQSFLENPRALNSKTVNSYKKTLYTFIELWKNNQFSKENLKTWMKQKKNRDTFLILYAIILCYETEKQSTNSLDFEDMLIYATKSLKEKKSPLPYQYIIIDEFQDSSWLRFKLINELVKQNDASLCVVGDDYQSIYRFNGCDLDIFLNFQKYYPTAKIYKLEQTYRNSEELITTAGKFIQKNPNQTPKTLFSEKHLKKSIVLLYTNHLNHALKSALKEIGPQKEILILGRNHFDFHEIIGEKKENQIFLSDFPQNKIIFSTIHAAKGLESDAVILINFKNDIYGFPSQPKEEKILTYVKKTESFPNEEERRLFYVALTRTKTKIYIIVPFTNPSSFTKEIKWNKNVQKKIIF